ncbi:MAG TPA: universal stress protein [Micromonosporaceae bacterium]
MGTTLPTARPGARPAPASAVGEPRGRAVVGVDGSPAGDVALEWAVTEAEVAGGDLLVCHAYAPEHIVRPLPAEGTEAAGQIARRCLAAAVAKAGRRLGSARVRGELRVGNPAMMLIEASAGAGMVVVGSHGYLGRGARLLGSTVLRVAGHADCPAVVVRPLLSGVRGPFADHVVVGVDGSQPASTALGFGFRYAALHDVGLVAVHVAGEWPSDFWTDDRMLQTYFVAEPPAEAMLSVEVEPWHHQFPGVPVKRAVYGGDPVRGLLRAAGGARLLVVGDRRRDELRRLMLGSVSRGVVSHAGCPVAVVHG